MRMVRVLESGDLAEIPFVVAADYLDDQGLDGSEIRGRDGFARIVAAAGSAWTDLRVTAADLIDVGDKVAVRRRWHGTNASGAAVDRETIDIVRFVDGLAIQHWGALLSTTA